MRILLVNDDGYDAPGIRLLAETLSTEHDVWLIAPDREVSAVGHAITLRQPLRAHPLSPRVWRVEGNPTDCVNLALFHIMPEMPDMILSGINRGWNLSEDITYSGTVAGAMEGAVNGIRSLALSIPADSSNSDLILKFAAQWVKQHLNLLKTLKLPDGVYLNLNWPSTLPIQGIYITRLGKRTHRNQVIVRTDPRGEPYFWLSRGEPSWGSTRDLDMNAVRQGFLSITPIRIDWTEDNVLASLRGQLEAI